MNRELEERKKLPEELKNVIDTATFYNIIMSIAIIIFIYCLNIAFKFLDVETFKTDMKIVAMLLLTGTIIIYEMGYKKDSGTLAITGIEMMVLSIIVLYMPFAYVHESDVVKLCIMLTSLFFSIYYVLKLIFFYFHILKVHKDSLSDVKEITKKEEKGYLNEKGKKIYKKGE